MKIIFVLVALQLFILNSNASQPMDLKTYLELECNVIDPSATGLVSEDLVSAKSCPPKASLFCDNGFAQAGQILRSELKKTNVYSSYIEDTSKIRQVVEILGSHYIVVANVDLVPLINQFWFDQEKNIQLEKNESQVSYTFSDTDKDINLIVEVNSETNACDFAQPQVEVIDTEI